MATPLPPPSSSPSPVQEVLLEIDHLRFVTSAEQAQLLLGLRARIALLVDAALSNATLDPSTTNRSGVDIDVDAANQVIAAVSSLVQSSDCGAGAMDAAQALPAGWVAVEDTSS
eukprot:COSAG01_NODE_29234_length_642_cov_0.924494_2_plen_113_part_01